MDATGEAVARDGVTRFETGRQHQMETCTRAEFALNCGLRRDITAGMSVWGYHLKRTRAKWLRFWRRPRAEKWLALTSFVMCLLSSVALRFVGLARWERILRASSGGWNLQAASSSDDLAIAEAHASVVDMVARNSWGLLTCLPRSLTLWWLLRRRGIESELHIGVRKEGARVAAHAWVVYHGIVIGDAEHKEFASFGSAVLAS